MSLGMEMTSFFQLREVMSNLCLSAEWLNIWNVSAYRDKPSRKSKNLWTTFSTWEMKSLLETISLYMRTTMDIGTSRRRKDPENLKVSFSSPISFNRFLLISTTLSQLKIGILKWESPTNEAIFFTDLQEQVKVHSLKPSLLKSSFQSVSSTVQTKFLTSILIVSWIQPQRNQLY